MAWELIWPSAAARRKLRDVLRPYAWQEWTRRHIEVPCKTAPAGAVVCPVGRAALSPLSMRDEFILKRARALWYRSFKFTAGYTPQYLSGAGGADLSFEGNELRNPQPSCDRENDFLDGNSVEHRHASRGQLATPARSGAVGMLESRCTSEVGGKGTRFGSRSGFPRNGDVKLNVMFVRPWFWTVSEIILALSL